MPRLKEGGERYFKDNQSENISVINLEELQAKYISEIKEKEYEECLLKAAAIKKVLSNNDSTTE